MPSICCSRAQAEEARTVPKKIVKMARSQVAFRSFRDSKRVVLQAEIQELKPEGQKASSEPIKPAQAQPKPVKPLKEESEDEEISILQSVTIQEDQVYQRPGIEHSPSFPFGLSHPVAPKAQVKNLFGGARSS